MADTNPGAAPATESKSGSGLLRVLRSQLDNAIVKGVGALLAGGLAFGATLMTPLKEVVADTIWPEKIEVGQTINVDVGQPTLFSILLQDRSPRGGLSGGKVSVSAPGPDVRLSGPTEFTFEQASGSVFVRPKDLTVQAVTPGVKTLHVEVVTNRGRTFEGDVTINAMRQGPTEKDLTGAYVAILNDMEGRMDLGETVEGQRRFSGEARFGGDRVYAIDGWRDGTGFSVTFLRDSAPVYRAEGIYCVTKHGELKWFVVNAKVAAIGAEPAAEAPPLTLVRTIREKCPGYPQDLEGLQGDGLFYASVSAN